MYIFRIRALAQLTGQLSRPLLHWNLCACEYKTILDCFSFSFFSFSSLKSFTSVVWKIRKQIYLLLSHFLSIGLKRLCPDCIYIYVATRITVDQKLAWGVLPCDEGARSFSFYMTQRLLRWTSIWNRCCQHFYQRCRHLFRVVSMPVFSFFLIHLIAALFLVVTVRIVWISARI